MMSVGVSCWMMGEMKTVDIDMKNFDKAAHCSRHWRSFEPFTFDFSSLVTYIAERSHLGKKS